MEGYLWEPAAMNEPLQWQTMAITVHICVNIKNRDLSCRGSGKKKADYVSRNFVKYNPL